jgi:hypothetical protein
VVNYLLGRKPWTQDKLGIALFFITAIALLFAQVQTRWQKLDRYSKVTSMQGQGIVRMKEEDYTTKKDIRYLVELISTS